MPLDNSTVVKTQYATIGSSVYIKGKDPNC